MKPFLSSHFTLSKIQVLQSIHEALVPWPLLSLTSCPVKFLELIFLNPRWPLSILGLARYVAAVGPLHLPFPFACEVLPSIVSTVNSFSCKSLLKMLCTYEVHLDHSILNCNPCPFILSGFFFCLFSVHKGRDFDMFCSLIYPKLLEKAWHIAEAW